MRWRPRFFTAAKHSTTQNTQHHRSLKVPRCPMGNPGNSLERMEQTSNSACGAPLPGFGCKPGTIVNRSIQGVTCRDFALESRLQRGWSKPGRCATMTTWAWRCPSQIDIVSGSKKLRHRGVQRGCGEITISKIAESAGSIDPQLKFQPKRKGRPKPPLQVLDWQPEKAGVAYAPPLSW
jgi:hypothetical protein